MTAPWHGRRDIAGGEFGSFIGGMASRLRVPEGAVSNIHVPPFATGLDSAPLLDDNFKPLVAAGEVATGPVGSKAVRAPIERYQPLVSLHGHVHESRGGAKLGRTT